MIRGAKRGAAAGRWPQGPARPWGSRGLHSPRGCPGRRAHRPLTFQDEGVDVPVDAQEVALPPEARVGGEERPAALRVQPAEPQQRAPGLGVGAPRAPREQPAPQRGRVPQRQVRQRHQAVLLVRGVGARAAALAALLVAPGVGLVPVVGEDGRDEQPQGAEAEAEAERRDERPRLHGFPPRRSRRWARAPPPDTMHLASALLRAPSCVPPPAPHLPPAASPPSAPGPARSGSPFPARLRPPSRPPCSPQPPAPLVLSSPPPSPQPLACLSAPPTLSVPSPLLHLSSLPPALLSSDPPSLLIPPRRPHFSLLSSSLP